MTYSSHTQNDPPTSSLHRSADHRIFAGVAGGLGEHLGINAWWFRWAFIFLSLFAGVGLLVYVLAWIVIPGPGEDDPHVSRWLKGVDWSDGGSVFGIVLVGIAAVLLLSRVIDVSGTLVLAAVMFVVGLLLYRGDLKIPPTGGGAPTGTKTASSDDAEAGSEVLDAGATGAEAPGPVSVAAAVAVDQSGSSGTAPPKPKPPKPPKPPRERSILGRLTIAIGLIVVASIALLDVSDLALDIDPFHYLAAAVAVLGVGLLVGAWVGRARWLIIVGLMIVPFLWVSLLLPTSWSFSVGEFHHTPTSIHEVDVTYQQGIGQMTIDLTNLTAEELGDIGTIQASLGLGEMIVRVPGDIGVELKASVGAGEVSGPFRTFDGVGINKTRVFGPEPTDLTLDLEVGAGVIEIRGPTDRQLNDNDALNFEWSN